MASYAYMESGAIPSYNIQQWDAAGRPKRMVSKAYNLPARAQWKCVCDIPREKGSSQSLRDAFYRECGTCGAQYRQLSGLQYSPSLQAFVGEGVTAPDAVTVAPILPSPVEAEPRQSQANLNVEAVETWLAGPQLPLADRAAMADIGTFIGTGVGTIVGGPAGGAIGGTIGGIFGGGESVCSGPYDYRNGMCVPKPDCKQRNPYDPCTSYPAGGAPMNGGPGVPTGGGYTGGSSFVGTSCPNGYYWDGTRCAKGGFGGFVERTIPGGSTGVYEGYTTAGQWTTTDTPMGAGYIPQAVSSMRLRCPPGYVLCGNRNGQNPGMEVCLPKGRARGCRKWRPGARPLLTGGDMKTLRKAKSLQKKVQKAWRASGSPGQRKCTSKRKR